MFTRAIKTMFKLCIYIFVLSVIVFFLPLAITTIQSKSRISKPEDILKDQVAIVFGAGLWRDGTPTPILRDRITTAAELFFSGKVEKLLMSGDNRAENYNEPRSMRDYAISLGIPETDIVLDFAGQRTYDTCYRARDIFKISSAILVTQSFHLPRAVYTCSALGLSVQGVSADRQDYLQRSQTYWNFREYLATIVALWELHVSQPLPILGQPEPIFPVRVETN